MFPAFSDLRQAKQAARRAAKARLQVLSPEALQAAGREISHVLFARPDWQAADTVFCFVSLPSEVDTLPILQAALAGGKRLCVPRMLGGGQMEIVCISALETLHPNALGIREPLGGQVLAPTDLGARALAVVPCLAVSRDGVRLGRGGGYYDRFLAGFGGHAVLLCPRALVFDSLPAEPWDARFSPADILTGGPSSLPQDGDSPAF